MESFYHIVTIRVNETSWAHVWRLRSCNLRTGYDRKLPPPTAARWDKAVPDMKLGPLVG
jgi:hypothetical protein